MGLKQIFLIYSVGILAGPCGVTVNDQDEIAVTECGNHGVSVFSSDGTHALKIVWLGGTE